MIRIAILDDDESERVLMEKLTRNYFFEKHVPCEIRVFSLGGSLVAELAEKKYFDIFLLDMELGDRGKHCRICMMRLLQKNFSM